MRKAKRTAQRTGIYSGAFDPVHSGHIALALQAIKAARLDQVVFLPERLPRRKPGVEHYAHRVGMLQRAVAPYPNMSVLELTDKRFNVSRTWPTLRQLFDGQLVLLLGSDVLVHLPGWPQADSLLRDCELVVGVRGRDTLDDVCRAIQKWPVQPQGIHIFDSFSPHVSSTSIREALAEGMRSEGLLASVRRYVSAEWLYLSVRHACDQIESNHNRGA